MVHVHDPIPSGVQEFILRHIDFVAQLDALLLVRDNPHELWSSRQSHWKQRKLLRVRYE